MLIVAWDVHLAWCQVQRPELRAQSWPATGLQDPVGPVSNVTSAGHALDDVQKVPIIVRQLKSRGVTRYYDLHHLNKRNLAEVETHEHSEEFHGDLMEEESDQRHRWIP